MPQLDKFTYFTWSCLLLFTCYIFLCRSFFPCRLEAKLYSYYMRSIRFQRVLFLLKFGFFLFIILRAGFILWNNISLLLYQHPLFGILPSELLLLDHYLNQPHQDPEWVEFVRQRLQTHGLSPRKYEIMVRDFLNTEICFATREQISELYRLIFYGREDPKFFIDPLALDFILKAQLETVEFNQTALCQILKSLCNERHESPFYSEVKTTQAEHFQGFLKQKHQAQLDMQHRQELSTQWESIERRNASLREENAFLRRKIFLLDREKDKAP